MKHAASGNLDPSKKVCVPESRTFRKICGYDKVLDVQSVVPLMLVAEKETNVKESRSSLWWLTYRMRVLSQNTSEYD